MNTKKTSAIEKITLSTATYNEVEFKPTYINFFYGGNGVGKTTIARSIEANDGLKWKPGKSESDYDVLVFNQDFINDNFQSYGNLPGVFTVCEHNIEIQNEVDEKTELKTELDERYVDYTTEKASKETALFTLKSGFQNNCWEKSRELREFFDAIMKGKKRKEMFADAILSITSPKKYDLKSLKRLNKVAFDSEARTYNYFTKVSNPVFSELKDLMEKSILSRSETPFANFIKALNATDWVRQGHSHFSEEAAGKCPYCQQKLPKNFEKDIASCFDAQYQQDISDIKKFQTVYTSEMSGVLYKLKNNLLDVIPSLDLTEYKDKLALLESRIKINLQRIAEKIKEPTTIVTLDDTDLNEIGMIIDNINLEIKANNEVVNAKKSKQEECSDKVWDYLAYTLKEEVSSYHKSQANLKKEINELSGKATACHRESLALAAEIVLLNKQVVSTKAAIDSINKYLHDSGFQGFSLREKKGFQNVYEVIRTNGSVAENLSDGERNFIAFLYFYHLVRGSHSSDEVKDKIVVIDDPVSSMDGEILFIVSTLVREMIEICYNNTDYNLKEQGDYIKQIFVLTHNVYFHREITNYQVNRYESVSFFKIKKADNLSKVELCERQSAIDPMEKENFNPVKDSYAELWSNFKEHNSPLSVLNTIRRILEYYFLQLCGYDGADIRKIVLEDNKDKFIIPVKGGVPDYTRYNLASAMLAYINNPNGIGDGLNYGDDVEKYKAVFKQIFEALHQEQHYNMMMGQGELMRSVSNF